MLQQKFAMMLYLLLPMLMNVVEISTVEAANMAETTGTNSRST
jgi:hypothetical protein